MSDKAKKIIKIVLTTIITIATAILSGLGLSSCNVTRSISTESKYFTRGDTTCTIITKTIESYDATKKRL